ncbi:hypothetical protein ACF0H5_009044 [Mactra antiquata]
MQTPVSRHFFANIPKHTVIVVVSLVFASAVYLFFAGSVQDSHFVFEDFSDEINIKDGSRSLLTILPNCTPRAIQQFPHDVFTTEERKKGAIVLHVLTTIYMFLGFALLCDDYFVPSLEVICEVLHIQSDVAGATFMAAGSSAPELATAIIAVFIAEDDIGIGTVVGSAVYNVMFVISVCALCAGMVVDLNWWPLFRDCLFYTLSVTALAFVIIDELVFWYEAVIFIVLYLLYIILMYFNTSLEMWIVPKFSCCIVHKQNENIDVVVMVSNDSNGTIRNGYKLQESSFIGQDFDSDFEDDDVDTSEPLITGSQQTNGACNHDQDQILNTDSQIENVLAYPTAKWKQIIWWIALPLRILFFITIPDCRYPKWRNWFILTFVMSLVWLSVLSYVMVWMITIIGYTAGIADTVMGLTFIAFGVSLPDVISSVIVVREGLGDMALSNAVGSNVFDILICLGIPWLIKSLLRGGNPVRVYSAGLLYATLTLLGTVVFLLLATHVNGWRLTKKYGVVLMLVYIGFTVLTALYELNIFGYVHPNECDIDL